MENKKAIHEINQSIRNGINNWADVVLEIEYKHLAYLMNYYPRDLMNVAYLFQHVVSNIGIKSGHITLENTEYFGKRFRELIIEMTGYDPHIIAADNDEEQK